MFWQIAIELSNPMPARVMQNVAHGQAVDTSDGNLRERGSIGIPLPGSAQIWHPFTGHLTAECSLA
jgi:hypothetical protein